MNSFDCQALLLLHLTYGQGEIWSCSWRFASQPRLRSDTFDCRRNDGDEQHRCCHEFTLLTFHSFPSLAESKQTQKS
ncbi:hypothetical protein KC19_2G233300 [Ceratodon purpureus]|uniref:Secreted protein n=1 Tax=Ceratodon purpureus TaxID=3225 RepID=A0A8T0J093_CERPU|nr:hypothetical protein KC19_2G233300 [Ceratodon purpureus]